MRYLKINIENDLNKKAILLSGARQVGKSTFAKSLMTKKSLYLNWDISKHRTIIRNISWDKDHDLVVLDELHKMPKWKNYLKGIIDEYCNRPRLLITGSARLDIFRKSGDALTGRQYLYHLHPIDVTEAKTFTPKLNAYDRMMRLLAYGGFPEAYLNPADADRLRNDRFDLIIREDLRDLSKVNSITAIQNLIDILRDRGCGTLSYSSLAEDLHVSAPTVKEWINLLQKLCLIFVIHPYTGSLSRSLKKEAKFYFYDCAATYEKGDGGICFENLVASTLIKFCDYKKDTEGKKFELRYFKDKEKREVDFVVTLNNRPYWLIECKTSDDNLSPSLNYLNQKLKSNNAFQLVRDISKNKEISGIKIVNAANWLDNIMSYHE
ncbi:MAG: ATP-binding protein [Oligoflexia bacterium]|nr:ATP-binding protein [Oligoflexia bacterium]